jgi:hypothetical protein
MNTELQSSQPKAEAAASTTLITIGESTVPVIEYKGKRVVTFAMVDQVHQRPEGTAKRNFQANKDHFIEGDDFYLIGRNKIRTDLLESFGFSKFAPSGLLLTQSGYLMLVKSFTDDLAWKVQRELVSRYFQPPPKSKAHELLRAVQLLVEHEDRMQALEQEQASQQKQINAIANRQANMDGDTGYMTALVFCRHEGMSAPLTFAQNLGGHAANACRRLKIKIGKVPDERWGWVNSYPVDVLRECWAAIDQKHQR